MMIPDRRNMFHSRKSRVIIGFLAVIGVGYLIAHFTQGSNGVPQEFTDARTQGALISQNIVDLSNQSTATLAQVDNLDREGNYKDALSLTATLVTQSEDIRSQAVALSNQVATMTQALSGVSNFTARQDALEAISDQLALLNQLVGYGTDLGTLLDTLRARFTGQSPTSATQVDALVNQINTDVNAVNNFNSQAKQAMQKFDTIEAGT